jgi:DNA-binding response OmpR family regulator
VVSKKLVLNKISVCGVFSQILEKSMRIWRTCTLDEILNSFWGYDYYINPRSIDRFVTTLRNKIEPDPHIPIFIHIIWEIGYRFEPTEQNN